MSANDEAQKLLQKYSSVLKEGIGEIINIQARLTITIKPNFKPVFVKARSVPFALRTKIEEEIENIVKQDVLKKVNSSNWVTLIVSVVRLDYVEMLKLQLIQFCWLIIAHYQSLMNYFQM